MANRPPFDRDPPPGGFDPRFRDGPDVRRDPYDGSRSEESFGRERERDVRGPDPFNGRRDDDRRPRRRGIQRSTKLLLGLGVLLLLGAIAFALSLGRSGPGSDRLDGTSGEGSSEETAAAAADPEARCAAPATYDRIKRELFRQAATTRGADTTTFNQLSGYSSLRVGNPVLSGQDEGLGSVTCSGDLALDLPPGLQVVGGRRTLTAKAEYILQPAADGSGDVVTLRGTDGIVVPLATLARTSAAQPEPAPVPDGSSNGTSEGAVTPATSAPRPAPPPPPEAPSPPRATPDRVPPPPVAAPPTANARPSFNCNRARTRGERAVCASDNLAALDRTMASQYVAALRDADSDQRALLQRTRDRFLGYRDSCRSDSCIADAYRGRITEIRDIVDGRWVAPR